MPLVAYPLYRDKAGLAVPPTLPTSTFRHYPKSARRAERLARRQ